MRSHADATVTSRPLRICLSPSWFEKWYSWARYLHGMRNEWSHQAEKWQSW